ncbi:RsmD family RNA methyltransferase [Flavihumibacter petaseus]|uniref:Putative RNA methyltransferase n=1 Tax=Flavihumibacter petaseus NBRC 106054 TaxID=1220578 RepID=A0A0E9N5F5_9BACT|nr:RsmD family RNA methyltransferase [Flavihumibacter petaseus]GAO44575.1 putative RNA methyltransferase [Flavihumibacter petaseus NBRC 106054]
MRIISGKLGGRRVNPPAKMPFTRPTTDIAKEGLFNILQQNIEFEGLKSLDLFGGTGSISYELASRGATDQTIVEKDPAMYAFIQKTAASFGLDHLKVIKSDVFKFIDSCNDQFDFIFAGPPYALEAIDELPRQIVAKGLLKPGGMFVLEHTPRNKYEGFEKFVQTRSYGTTLFSFFINR